MKKLLAALMAAGLVSSFGIASFAGSAPCPCSNKPCPVAQQEVKGMKTAGTDEFRPMKMTKEEKMLKHKKEAKKAKKEEKKETN